MGNFVFSEVECTQRTGIHKPLLIESDGLLLGGMGRKKCEQDRRRIAREPFEFQHELLVFDCSRIHWTQVMFQGNCTRHELRDPFFSRHDGFFSTASRMLLGQIGNVLGATEGTYKLYFGGWTLVSFGTFSVRYTSQQKYRQKFYPMVFIFVRTETTFAYTRMFLVCKDRCQEFFGGTVNLQFGSVDHSDAIANAYRDVWPDIKLLNCWHHLKQDEYAQWLDNEYLTDPWDLWFYAASGCPGVVPNQTPIEAHHRAIKSTAVNHLRFSTDHVIAMTLPELLVECTMGFGSDPIRHYASGPVSAEILEKALNRCEDDNHYPRHARKSQRAIDKLKNITSTQAITVSEMIMRMAFQTKVCARSLHGTLRANEAVENIQLRYLSLYCVAIRKRIAYAHDWNSSGWSHDAVQTILKNSSAIASHSSILGGCHVLACLHLVGDLNWEVVLHGLPARKPPGRPWKKKNCFVRDGVRQSQYSVDALIWRLVDKPTSVINWSVLMANPTAMEDGETTEHKPSFQRGGKRYWDVGHKDEDKITPLEAEELAQVISFFFQLGHIIVP
ncbi:LOW QUALITY PROTEIN: Hypothetical protein PHPALM_15295 [Phytophthora palmivora]|uniref:Uncharacterized protein n=1 Tax=Phytophthora palmivora TaxID=4796 RepID=A0A2P4XSL4_9STRA|nr:LOW QUALITY PROTEIN: Hypothetical protein PHPALM_15295 [Phytophthora palmivora]